MIGDRDEENGCGRQSCEFRRKEFSTSRSSQFWNPSCTTLKLKSYQKLIFITRDDNHELSNSANLLVDPSWPTYRMMMIRKTMNTKMKFHHSPEWWKLGPQRGIDCPWPRSRHIHKSELDPDHRLQFHSCTFPNTKPWLPGTTKRQNCNAFQESTPRTCVPHMEMYIKVSIYLATRGFTHKRVTLDSPMMKMKVRR